MVAVILRLPRRGVAVTQHGARKVICYSLTSSVAAVDRLGEVTDGQLTGIDLWRSRSRLETSPYGHDHGQAV